MPLLSVMLHAVPVQLQESAPQLLLKRDAATCELCLAAPQRRERRVFRSSAVERENRTVATTVCRLADSHSPIIYVIILFAVQTTVGLVGLML